MKNIIILTILLNIGTNGFSQNKSICGEIDYSQIKNLGALLTENYSLKFNDEISFYEEINIKSSQNEFEIEDKENEGGSTNRTNKTIIGRNNLTPKFYFNSNGDFYFMDNFANNNLFVKENNNKWNWKLHQETKQIGDFTCQKATISFRGRNYIAWFTNEIPVPFGPWKFQGLSGLILEVYDTNKIFHIYTNKIKINKVTDCDIRKIDKNQLKESMNILEYQNKKEKLINVELAKLTSRMPKGFKVPKFDKNCENCPKPLEIFDEEN